MEAVDPVVQPKFLLSRSDRIVTAGSCFAQHIARHLSQSGFNYLVTETAHPLIPPHIAEPFGYGVFTARYANIYTSRQMTQLLRRAYGQFQPDDDIWVGADGSILDPFRPQIQPGGFSSVAEFYADRAQHFAAIRKAVETLDCLVFTLGLTECWMSRSDGAVYPVCPGVSGGEFDADRHVFHNLTVSEVLSDLADIVRLVEEHNQSARFMLTVSPVPLVATASGEHVLSATTMSKSVLRAAAGEFVASHPRVAYFPSYEIITGQYARGIYFGSNLRDVTEAGVSHVMRLFLRHYGNVSVEAEPPQAMPSQAAMPDLSEMIKVLCEEEALQTTSNPDQSATPPVGLEILMHVQHHGDVTATGGSWAGNEAAAHWIEGFAIFVGGEIEPADLIYRATLSDGSISPWVPAGAFCGTRGQSRPLLGFQLQLRGAAAIRYDCLCGALFADRTRLDPSAVDTMRVAPSRVPMAAIWIELRPRSKH